MKYRINLEKNIGNVIFIVEGAVAEFNIAETIFLKTLGYELIEKSRDDSLFHYQNPHNPYSRVAVLNCAKNQLHTLDFEEINQLFSELRRLHNSLICHSGAIY